MAPNRQIGRFTLDDLVEERYGCQIWRAVDSTLNREVALWLVPADDSLVADLGQSTRTAATVDDRRIVRILDVFPAEDLLVIVTEWSAGEVLGHHLTAPMPAAEAARIALVTPPCIQRNVGSGIIQRSSTRAVFDALKGDAPVLGLDNCVAIAAEQHGYIAPIGLGVFDEQNA